jgi:hypothetical protein
MSAWLETFLLLPSDNRLKSNNFVNRWRCRKVWAHFFPIWCLYSICNNVTHFFCNNETWCHVHISGISENRKGSGLWRSCCRKTLPPPSPSWLERRFKAAFYIFYQVTVTAPRHSVHQIMTSELIDLIGCGLATSSQTEDPFSKTTWLAVLKMDSPEK